VESFCRRCGCTSSHYNRSRMMYVCDMCGTPVRESGNDQALMQFDRTFATASEHLEAGNWDQAISLISPLTSQYPTEKKLYVVILRAATQDFSDFEMQNEIRKNSASDAWDKLIRLRGVTPAMREYRKRGYEIKRDYFLDRKFSMMLWLFAASFCSFVAGILGKQGHYFWMVLFVLGFGGSLYMTFKCRPIYILKQLLKKAPDYNSNPFK